MASTSRSFRAALPCLCRSLCSKEAAPTLPIAGPSSLARQTRRFQTSSASSSGASTTSIDESRRRDGEWRLKDRRKDSPAPSCTPRRSLATVSDSPPSSLEPLTATDDSSASPYTYPVLPPEKRRLPKEPGPLSQRVYLPNIIFRLVRNGPPHTDDPFTATFRVSLQLTKPDIRSYLAQIYGLEITSLRTANYIGEDKYYPGKGWKRTRERTYKKVLVGLVEPFWYPEERSKEWLEREFMTSTQKDVSAVSKHKIRPIRYTNGASGWRWRGHSSEFRGRGIRLPELLRNVRERKVKAEEEVRKAVELKLKDEEAATLA